MILIGCYYLVSFYIGVCNLAAETIFIFYLLHSLINNVDLLTYIWVEFFMDFLYVWALSFK